MPSSPWLSHTMGFFSEDHKKTGVSFSAGRQVNSKGRIKCSQLCLLRRVGWSPQWEWHPVLSCGPVLQASWPFFFFESPLCARRFTYSISFNLYNHPAVNSPIIPFDRWKNWNSMRLSNLSQIIQLISYRAGLSTKFPGSEYVLHHNWSSRGRVSRVWSTLPPLPHSMLS